METMNRTSRVVGKKDVRSSESANNSELLSAIKVIGGGSGIRFLIMKATGVSSTNMTHSF